MTKSHISIIIGIAQIVAVFATVSTLLGRMYFISYLDAVGVPKTAINLNISDYAVLSPDVTLLAAGSAIIATVLWRRSHFIRLWSKWNKHSSLIGHAIAIGGIVVLAFSMAMVALTGSYQRYPGNIGLVLLIAFTIMIFGAIVIGSSSPEKVKKMPSISNSFLSKYVTRQVISTAGFVLCVLAVGLPLIYFPATIARIDAGYTLSNAPTATIEFADTGSISLPNGGDKCGLSPANCKFRVVIVGDEFLYARLVNSESASEKQMVYAIPKADIKSIAYEPR